MCNNNKNKNLIFSKSYFDDYGQICSNIVSNKQIKTVVAISINTGSGVIIQKMKINYINNVFEVKISQNWLMRFQ